MGISRTDKPISSQEWAEFVEFSDDARVCGGVPCGPAGTPNAMYRVWEPSYPLGAPVTP